MWRDSTKSDERLKKINGSYDSGVKAVMRLQPLRYEYEPPNNTMRLNSVGGRSHHLDLLNAIKEQQKEIAELKR